MQTFIIVFSSVQTIIDLKHYVCDLFDLIVDVLKRSSIYRCWSGIDVSTQY